MTDSRERPIRNRIKIIETYWLENLDASVDDIAVTFFKAKDHVSDEWFDENAKAVLRGSDAS